MKHSTKIFAATILLSAGLITTTFAQQAYTSASSKTAFVKNAMVTESDNNTKMVIAASPEVESRFSFLFPNASNQQWSVGTDNYWVSFLNNGQKANASFTSQGKMNYIITVCAMENLPAALRKAIKKGYADYSLFHATEIKAYGVVVYQAILENITGFTTLTYSIEGVEETRRVKK